MRGSRAGRQRRARPTTGWADGPAGDDGTDPGGVTVTGTALSHTYPGPSGDVPVLRGVDLHVPAGGYAALVGSSGAGKTTLLSLIGGLERVQTGELRVGEVDVGALHGDDLAAYRRTTVGFIFQNFGLLEALTAAENVELAAVLAGESPNERRRRVSGLLEAVGMGHRADHRPGALSGGERQRVAIARALVNRPRLILADEPTGNLDAVTAGEVIRLLESLHADHGCTLLLVTHDRALADRSPLRLELVGGAMRPRDADGGGGGDGGGSGDAGGAGDDGAVRAAGPVPGATA